jgi:hypothetical protein
MNWKKVSEDLQFEGYALCKNDIEIMYGFMHPWVNGSYQCAFRREFLNNITQYIPEAELLAGLKEVEGEG